MNKTRRSLSSVLMTLVLAFTMIFAMTTTAFATEGTDETTNTYTLTLSNTGKTEHTFEVYQIFTGELATDGTLTEIKWGSNVSAAGQTALGNAAEYAKTITDANVASVAETLSGYLTGDAKTATVDAGKTGTVKDLAAGYYFVKDKDDSQTGENSAYTSFILKVVQDTTAATKLDAPTVVKKVQDVNESTGEKTGWQDSADYKVGATIPYQITGTLPSNYDKYTTYYYQFSDRMSQGLSYAKGNAKITADGKDVTASFTESISEPDNDGYVTVTWTCTDLKKIEGVTLTSASSIIVNYDCTLNDNAVMGSAGNPNYVKLIYANNPNKGGDGDHGETPEDKNIVFTYNVTVNKYANEVKEGNELTGAGFTLYKEVKSENGTSWVPVGDEVKGEALTTFTWNRVDDGNYKLSETSKPSGYNKMDDIFFTISAKHDTESDDPKLTELTGDVTSGSATFEGKTADGTLTTNVINEKGSNLPSTGGMGTTLFYVIGAILVLGAGVILVTRRRMESK